MSCARDLNLEDPVSQPTCSLLPWDSEFFGYPVARLHERRVDARVLADAFGWCTARAVRCLYYLAPADDAASLLAAQAAGMQFVDIRLTLTRTLASDETWAVGATITPATEADQALLVALAPHLARVSRFSADPRFGHEAAVRLHTAWLRKEAGAALAARTPNGVGGCIKCDVEPDGTGVISLLVVAPENSGQNLGVALCAPA